MQDSKNPPPPIKNPPHPPLAMISLGNTKRTVLELLSKGLSTHRIAKKTHRDKSTIVQHLKDLQQMGLCSKSILWSVTAKGKDYLGGGFSVVGYDDGGVVTTAKKFYDRAHNIKIKVAIIAQPHHKNWLKGWKKNDKMKYNVFYTRRFGEIVTTYTGKNLIFQLPPLTFKDSDTVMCEAGRITMALIKQYEEDVQGLKLGEHDIKAQVISQHHAIPNHPYAIFLHKHGISYQDELIDIDASTGIPELEVKGKKSHLHHTAVINDIKDKLINNPPTNTVLGNSIYQTQQQINTVVMAQHNLTQQLQVCVNILTPRTPPEQEPQQQKSLHKKSDYIG